MCSETVQLTDAHGRPGEKKAAKSARDEPVERRELVSSSEDGVERRSVCETERWVSGAAAYDETVQLTDYKHSQDGATDDASEVVGVVDDLLAERRQETGLAGELGRRQLSAVDPGC